MKTITVLLTVCITTTLANAWSMQETRPAASAPVAGNDGKEKLIATVTGVEGIVQVRESEDQPWTRATVGQQVGENAEFRTGPRSAVRFVIPPDHTITLDRLGTVKVLQAVNDNGVIKTQMGMRYGRTRYDIEAAGREHESSIASPSSTLAVRGTKFSSYDQRPFPAQGVSLTGRVQFRDLRKRVAFGSRGGGKTKIDVNNPNAASLALGEAVVDPGARLARTAAEDKLVTTLISSGATVEFDYDKGIRVVRGGQPPRTDAELVPTLPGALNFVLRWTQPGTDLNIGVFTQGGQDFSGGEQLQPFGGVSTTASGGVIGFDHRGGPNGGIEVASWPAGFPQQPYSFGSVHISGPNSPATFDVFRDGQRVTIIGGGGEPSSGVSYIAGPINPEFGSGQFVGSVNIAPPQEAQSRPDKSAAQRRTLLAPGGANARPMGPRPPKVTKR